MNNSPLKLNLVGSLGVQITFTNADEDAEHVTAADSTLAMDDSRRDIPSGEMKFNKGQTLHVSRARLIARGAPGLAVAQGKEVAADLLIGQGHDDSGFVQNTDTGSVPLRFVEWDRWEDKDFTVKFTEDQSVLGLLTGSSFYYMDINLQDAFASADFKPALELEAEIYIGG